MENPLLSAFDLAPFHTLDTDHFAPAFDAALEAARAEIKAITEQSEAPEFQNTIAALDFAGYQLDRISSVFFNLNSAETNPKIQALAQEVSPKLSEFANDITLNTKLFERVKAVYDQRDSLDLTAEEQTLLERKYRHFKRNGANLSAKGKERLREIDAALSRLKLTFGEHVLEETNTYSLHLTEETDLAGLPQAVIEAARMTAEAKALDGWVFTLEYPSYLPFMKYAANRNLRKELSRAFGSKGFHGDSLDNQEMVRNIAALRWERARLLGYENHAHFVLEERMAKTPEAVQEFLADLLAKAMPAARREKRELEEFARDLDGITSLESWDTAYYSEKLRQQKFALDDEKLKPYFELDAVLQGAFSIAGKLYGLAFEPDPSIPVYHKEVQAYRVQYADGKLAAVFYADFHPRPGKRGGAWMTSYKPQFRKEGVNERPHISIVCNFTRPTRELPALLTFNEVTTLFHEFGHALHGMLADTTYPGLSGTSVFWDFVELPSQIMENWCYQQEALAYFAKHYKSGEPLPMEWVDRIRESANFLEGMATVRQLSFGFLDMAWHGTDPSQVTDVKAYESKAFENTRLFPENPDTCMSTSFSHIFQGGYASGYYSYKWAEVLDADAFAYFEEEGIFDRDIAQQFSQHILSRGGTEDPMVLYKRFRGREPQLDALLKRAGLLPAAT